MFNYSIQFCFTANKIAVSRPIFFSYSKVVRHHHGPFSCLGNRTGCQGMKIPIQIWGLMQQGSSKRLMMQAEVESYALIQAAWGCCTWEFVKSASVRGGSNWLQTLTGFVFVRVQREVVTPSARPITDRFRITFLYWCWRIPFEGHEITCTLSRFGVRPGRWQHLKGRCHVNSQICRFLYATSIVGRKKGAGNVDFLHEK